MGKGIFIPRDVYEQRSKYGVVGSGVNMTSRIESYTVDGQILISDSVRKQAGNILRIDEQREVIPKGSEAPIRIYEVGGIGAPYHLALAEKDPAPVALGRRVPLPGLGPSYHIDYAGIMPQKRVFSGPISSFSTPESAL
ncbi:MAG: adenylate/guanylate cyclase domain-containing protein [Pseudomonadota bacterium]